jgi:hypothetical protein
MAGVKLTEDLARRLIAALKWIEAYKREAARLKRRRRRRGRGDHGMLRYRLLEQLDRGGSANAVLTYQDVDGVWSDGGDEEDESLVYDALMRIDEHLVIGSYVYCCRDHRSGLLNVVNADNCAEV